MTQDLCVESLGGQEHDREVGRTRGAQVLRADGLGLKSNGPREGIGRLLYVGDVSTLGGILKAHVVLLRELRVDGEPNAGLRLVLGPGEADGELDKLARVLLRLHVATELRGREDLLEQRAELDFGPRSARLHVRQDALEVADAGCEVLHLAEPTLDRFEPLAHELEGLAQSLFERVVQLLVDGLAHLLELLLVAVLELLDARVDGGADQLERPGIRLAEFLELLVHAVELTALDLAHGSEVVRERRVRGGESGREFLA